jgi:hypothetical protein
MDTWEYEVTFLDGSVNSYLPSTIAENIYSCVDQEGRNYTLLSQIIDHEEDLNVTKGELSWHTTQGWCFLVSWKDGSTSYVSLREMKNSYPVETAEYAISNQINTKPAFIWWVPYVLFKCERLISKAKKSKTKYWHHMQKYGIELPKSASKALEIEQKTGTTFWHDAIEKEMKNVLPAFEFCDDDKAPTGYKHITCHMIFDVKMIGLVRKARFVAGGHLTDPPVESVFTWFERVDFRH